MESVVFVLQVSSIIEAVVKEVDKALQLLHSRVCFILLYKVILPTMCS